MSTASLPSYIAPSFTHTPLYSLEPHEHEQRIALGERLRPRPAGHFVKATKSGDLTLTLNAQEDNAALPVYGTGSSVEGKVELAKPEGVGSVEVTIEGRLRLNEIAEGGTSSAKLCLNTAVLWSRDAANPTACPSTLDFRLELPVVFQFEGKTYPLPPTFDVKLSGLPGFTATIDYSVTVSKSQSAHHISLFGINIGGTTVSTPFIYYPRTRPSSPLPPPLLIGEHGFLDAAGWQLHPSEISVKNASNHNIVTKLYIPSTRIFCISQPIPFYLTLTSSAFSLAAFLPFGPRAGDFLPKRPTRIQLMRQSTVDVRGEVIKGTKTDMWKVDCIGEGKFEHAADGANWISFSGEIKVNRNIRVAGFKAAGLTVKDCIIFSMTAPDPKKCPFHELRQAIPVKLTTDEWSADGTGVGAAGSTHSLPSTPGDYMT
ncbi:hypothetical protein BD779DRAFT_1619326 [Infundibulicybe gibba]|nr:hypothetical protein BD779DRAFT_1619326 [Infundibulicybe gibba]